MSEFDATIIFEKNWDAINERTESGSRRYRYIINKGSSRSSKTLSIIKCYYLYALQNQSKRLSVWRDTKKDCKDTVGNDMKIAYPSMPLAHTVLYNKTESIYQFNTSGSAIEICGTDEPNRLHGYNCDVAWLNEPYAISRETFDQLDMRTAEFLIMDWNPKQNHWLDTIAKDPRAIVINSTFRDNPFCPEEQRLKILSYQPVSETAIVKGRKLSLGDAIIYDILLNPKIFTDKELSELSRAKENEAKGSASIFNWKVYGLGEKAERPNRVFNNWGIIKDSDYEAIQGKKYYGVDWGQIDPWGILEAKYYDGAIYFKELNYRSENELKLTMSTIERETLSRQEEGLVKWMFAKLDIPKNAYIVCDDNRAMKVVALREAGYSYALTAAKGPGSIMEGINLLDKIRVYATESSHNLIIETENYIWKTFKGEAVEEPEDANNHLIDPSRYLVLFLRALGIIKII